MAQLLPLTLAKLLLIMPPAEFLSHKKINAPLHRNFRLAWLKYLIYTHRILILLINPISIHIICTSLVKFTSHFGIPLGTLPGSGNYLFSPRKFSSVPLAQHYACAMTFNMASGQGPGYWDNIMNPVGTRSWTRLGPGHGPGWDPVMDG